MHFRRSIRLHLNFKKLYLNLKSTHIITAGFYDNQFLSMRCCFTWLISWQLPVSPSLWIHSPAFCQRAVARFEGHKAPWAAGSAVCAGCIQAIPEKSTNRRSRAAARESRSNVHFLKSVGKYLPLAWHAHCTLLAASCHSGRQEDGG